VHNDGMDDDPLGSVESAESDELKRLRRRAYGPDADIAGDAAAQARLSELEAAQRGQPSPAVDAAGVAARLPERAPAAPWWRRRRWLAILGGGIAALALNGALIVWMSQPLAPEPTSIPTDSSTATTLPVPDGGVQPGAPDDGLAPDYVLALKSFGVEADKPKDLHGTLDSLGLSSDQLGRYQDFQGLGVWSGESRSGMACLLLAHPGQGLREGIGDEACSPEGLDTIAELPPCCGYSGPGFLDGLPTGSVPRFELKGDRVYVYVYVD
jgi:hypothetical protein